MRNFSNLSNFKIDPSQLPVYQFVKSDWDLADYLGNIRVRSAFNRYQYKVNPGLYAIGKPNTGSDVFVTANYKLTFDILRSELAGMDAWILVLDTKGINVWCAAGKGSFGTKELINRIHLSKLSQVVTHKKIIVPQLGAVGIAAHEIRNETGFKVVYGPVRASDIKMFVKNCYIANNSMRTVEFTLKDRIILTPVEFVMNFKYLFLVILAFGFISGIEKNSYSLVKVLFEGGQAGLLLTIAYFTGTFLTPVFLPLIPGRAFATKGAIMGLMILGILLIFKMVLFSWLSIGAWGCVFISVSSFLGMNFTGASTYTSITGVEKEMKVALPIQISLAATGIVLYILSQIFSL